MTSERAAPEVAPVGGLIRGSLKDVPIGDVFQILATGQKTGVLEVNRQAATARIHFDGGKVQFASMSPGAHLGEVLVRMELLTAYEVQAILLKQATENTGMPLGTQAVELGFIVPDELNRALRAQVVEVMSELMYWKRGVFRFSEDVRTSDDSRFVGAYDAQMLLMEVTAKVESWDTATVDPTAVFERASDPTKTDMPKGAWEVLGYLDGSRSAASVAAELDLPERETFRILFELDRLGVIRPSPIAIDEPLVLVVAKSSGIGRITRLALRRARLNPILAPDFDSALAALAQHRPRAIIVDDDGAQAWEFVRNHRQRPDKGRLPVLMLTAGEGPQGLFARLKLRRTQLLRKPFQEIELQKAVCSIVGSPL